MKKEYSSLALEIIVLDRAYVLLAGSDNNTLPETSEDQLPIIPLFNN